MPALLLYTLELYNITTSSYPIHWSDVEEFLLIGMFPSQMYNDLNAEFSFSYYDLLLPYNRYSTKFNHQSNHLSIKRTMHPRLSFVLHFFFSLSILSIGSKKQMNHEILHTLITKKIFWMMLKNSIRESEMEIYEKVVNQHTQQPLGIC
jgi:hypothetical protein